MKVWKQRVKAVMAYAALLTLFWTATMASPYAGRALAQFCGLNTNGSAGVPLVGVCQAVAQVMTGGIQVGPSGQWEAGRGWVSATINTNAETDVTPTKNGAAANFVTGTHVVTACSPDSGAGTAPTESPAAVIQGWIKNSTQIALRASVTPTGVTTYDCTIDLFP